MALVTFDQVFRLAALTIKRVIQPLSAARGDVADHEADVEAESGRLDAGRDTTRTRPGFGPILCFGVAPQQRGIGFGATDTNIVSCRLDQATQHVVAGQAEDVANIFRFAPVHHLWSAVMAVTADGDARVRPMPSDLAQQAPQVTADFLPRWGFAGPQQHRHRPRRDTRAPAAYRGVNPRPTTDLTPARNLPAQLSANPHRPARGLHVNLIAGPTLWG